MLIYLLFFAFFREGTNTGVNIIPFYNIAQLTFYTFTTGHDFWHWFINVPGNILAFIPMAVPLQFYIQPKLSRIVFILLIILIPFLVEFLQYIFQRGSADIDDWILNVVGIYLGLITLHKIRF